MATKITTPRGLRDLYFYYVDADAAPHGNNVFTSTTNDNGLGDGPLESELVEGLEDTLNTADAYAHEVDSVGEYDLLLDYNVKTDEFGVRLSKFTPE